ncbi:MAG TPA: hypothetical protein VNA69_14790 [Thermoanaerobaculia bacterium]|nr:hypothetical protein [Thermoanaerobaculia bacterium]
MVTLCVSDCTSQSGNWNSAATWGGVGVPTSLDDVTITGGFTVTVSDGQLVDPTYNPAQ